MSKWDEVPAPGAVWLCGACGRVGRGKRSDLGDESCVMWATMVHECSIQRDETGRIVAATAVKQGARDGE